MEPKPDPEFPEPDPGNADPKMGNFELRKGVEVAGLFLDLVGVVAMTFSSLCDSDSAEEDEGRGRGNLESGVVLKVGFEVGVAELVGWG